MYCSRDFHFSLFGSGGVVFRRKNRPCMLFFLTVPPCHASSFGIQGRCSTATNTCFFYTASKSVVRQFLLVAKLPCRRLLVPTHANGTREIRKLSELIVLIEWFGSDLIGPQSTRACRLQGRIIGFHHTVRGSSMQTDYKSPHCHFLPRKNGVKRVSAVELPLVGAEHFPVC